MNHPNRLIQITSTGLMFLFLSVATSVSPAQENPSEQVPTLFLALVDGNPQAREVALQQIAETWRDEFIPMTLESVTLMRDANTATQMIQLLQSKTGQNFGFDINRWFEWVWNREPTLDPQYPQYKSLLYGLIDPRFSEYFHNDRTSLVRLDEVRWGGVRQDGIPPLRNPKMIDADQATYLGDNNVVFGLEVNGDARAYPKRILAWHEMFVDDVGGVPVAGVYCTLCGSMILYETTHNGVNHQLGTSGFLFRSNKLMYDQATQSLWNTMWGGPVIGPLATQDITLQRRSVVTTTWGEWKRRHPKTSVLSLATGHVRDYSEGAAYRDYFATDELMFSVPTLDTRLRNKDEVVGLLFDNPDDEPLAISAVFLSQNPLYQDQVGTVELVVLTDPSGANRVYQRGDTEFVSWDGDQTAIDASGGKWLVSESQLESEDGESLARLPAHRAFWFGWYGAYPHTRLVM